MIEDYRQGYPRFSALIGSHPAFAIFRRFMTLRARVLLYKQDELSILEENLNAIDGAEQSELFLGCKRLDSNPQRAQLVFEIEQKLSSYDRYLVNYKRVSSFPSPEAGDIESLRNWLEDNSPISRAESCYLDYADDLFSMDSDGDVVRWLQDLIERFSPFGFAKDTTKCRDRSVNFTYGRRVQLIARCILFIVAMCLVVAPIIALHQLDTALPRVITALLSIAAFSASLLSFTRATTVELFLATATYGAVMVVFITDSFQQNN